MKRILFIALFSLLATVSFGQYVNTQTIGSPTTLFKSRGGLASDSSFILLNNYADTTAANFSVSKAYMGSFIRIGSTIWVRGSSLGNNTPNRWYQFAQTSSTGSVTSISQGFGITASPNPITTIGTILTDTTVIVSKSYFNNFNALNVKYADTAAMLLPYLRKSDTASMLSNYYNKTAADGRFVPLTRNVNTNAPLAGGGSLATDLTLVADTGRAVGQLSTGGSLNKVKDSLVALISSSGGGTVLSVATTNGFGINSSVASPTTNANITIAVDTSKVPTRYTTDSIAILKLNISDTSTMLSNYLRKSDTLTILSPYLRKTDTLTMLAPYLRKTDTLTMLSPYLRKTDTLTMLSPYLRKTDTATMLSPYLRKTDTASMLLGYVRELRFLDTTSTLRALINTKGAGTVTSVGLSMPSIFSVSNSPVTSSGTLTVGLQNQNANLVFASPSTGSPAQPTFRSLVEADIPNIYVKYTDTTSLLSQVVRTFGDQSVNGEKTFESTIYANTTSSFGIDVNNSTVTGIRVRANAGNGISSTATASAAIAGTFATAGSGSKSLLLANSGSGDFITAVRTGVDTNFRVSNAGKITTLDSIVGANARITGTINSVGEITSISPIVSTDRGIGALAFVARLNTSALNDSLIVVLGQSANGTYNLFELTQYQRVANQSTGGVALNIFDNGGRQRVQNWERDSIVMGRPLIVRGQTTLRSNGAPLMVNSLNSNTNKITFQDNGTDRGSIGASSTNLFVASNSSGAGIFTINNSTAATTLSQNQNATTEIVVSNTDNTNSTSRGRVTVTGGTVTTVVTSVATDAGYVGTSSNHQLNLITNGVTRIGISSSGDGTIDGKWTINAGSGAYSSTGASGAPLQVNTTSATTFPINAYFNAVGTSDNVVRHRYSNNGTDRWQINYGSDITFFENNAGSLTSRFSLTSAGAATFSSSVTATGFIVSSDKRLKNILSRDGDMVKYTLKSDPLRKPHFGYIAQEVEKYLPETVSENEKGEKAVNYIEVLVYKVRQLEKEISKLKKQINEKTTRKP